MSKNGNRSCSGCIRCKGKQKEVDDHQLTSEAEATWIKYYEEFAKVATRWREMKLKEICDQKKQEIQKVEEQGKSVEQGSSKSNSGQSNIHLEKKDGETENGNRSCSCCIKCNGKQREVDDHQFTSEAEAWWYEHKEEFKKVAKIWREQKLKEILNGNSVEQGSFNSNSGPSNIDLKKKDGEIENWESILREKYKKIKDNAKCEEESEAEEVEGYDKWVERGCGASIPYYGPCKPEKKITAKEHVDQYLIGESIAESEKKIMKKTTKKKK